jgi:polyphosphate kinase
VEVVTPVQHPQACQRLDWILTTELADPTAWELRSDGSYARRSSAGGDARSAQEQMMDRVNQPTPVAGRA